MAGAYDYAVLHAAGTPSPAWYRLMRPGFCPIWWPRHN